MYVPDESILGDKEFLRRILADLPATDAAGGLDGAMTAETSA
jgi:hypothetical protein